MDYNLHRIIIISFSTVLDEMNVRVLLSAVNIKHRFITKLYTVFCSYLHFAIKRTKHNFGTSDNTRNVTGFWHRFIIIIIIIIIDIIIDAANLIPFFQANSPLYCLISHALLNDNNA
jgi:uncharacterized membrane protein